MIGFHLIGTENSQKSQHSERFIWSLADWWHSWTAEPLLPGRSPARLHALGRFSRALKPQTKPNITCEIVDSLKHYRGKFPREQKFFPKLVGVITHHCGNKEVRRTFRLVLSSFSHTKHKQYRDHLLKKKAFLNLSSGTCLPIGLTLWLGLS